MATETTSSSPADYLDVENINMFFTYVVKCTKMSETCFLVALVAVSVCNTSALESSGN